MTGAAYLDHNATSPIRPSVAAVIARALALTGNASSVHGFGRAARRTVEAAREQVATLVGAKPAEVVFTSGGTEANALALAGCGRRRVLATAVEHDSVLAAADGIETVPVDASGVVDLAALDDMLAAEGAATVVSVMLANNETGVVQPVEHAADIARRHDALVHCDAVQAAGKIPVRLEDLGVDMLTLSAHKMGGPQGVGALVVGTRVELGPRLRGGGQERGRRAGTEAVALIAGFGAAAGLAVDVEAEAERLARLRLHLEGRIEAVAPDARIHGALAGRLPNTTCVTMPGVASETQVIALDLAGVAVSAGAACSSGKVRPSHVLRAMGVAEDEAACAIRVSLGWTTTGADVDRFLAAWADLYARRRSAATLAPVLETTHDS